MFHCPARGALPGFSLYPPNLDENGTVCASPGDSELHAWVQHGKVNQQRGSRLLGLGGPSLGPGRTWGRAGRGGLRWGADPGRRAGRVRGGDPGGERTPTGRTPGAGPGGAGRESGRPRPARRPTAAWLLRRRCGIHRPRDPSPRRHGFAAAVDLQLEHAGRVRGAQAAADLLRAGGAQRAGHQPPELAAGAGGVRPCGGQPSPPGLCGLRGLGAPGEPRLSPPRGGEPSGLRWERRPPPPRSAAPRACVVTE